MGLKWRNLEFVYVDPFICFKDDVSSGPSSGDISFSNPLQTIFSGFGSSTGSGIGPDPATAMPGAGAIGGGSSAAEAMTGSRGAPQFSIGGSSSFSPESSASSSAGGASPGGASPFSSIASPGVGTTGVFGAGAQPFQTFGNVGAATGTGLLGAGGATGAPGVPAGVSSPTGLDPTQGGGAAAPFSTTGTAAPAAAASPSGGSFLENLFSKVGSTVSNNPLSFLGAAGMAFNAYQANQAMKDIPSLGQIAPQLQEQAASLSAQGKQLASYLTSGNLPPGLQASLDQATKAAKASIISNFAARGAPTDPTKNSALAAELAAVDAQAVVSTAQIGQQLLQTGVNETQLSSSLYTTLANIDQAAQDRISKSIANFAAALAPSKGTGGLSINLGKG
ncbi:MAG TPA: hypothetical protein VIV09_01650 [Pseudolabrys sp.]